MKVLVLGVYKNGTGWGNACQDMILALDAAGVEVVPRNISLTANNDGEVPKRILELEKRSSSGCGIIIQHILPHLMDYNGNFDRCIGVFESETSHFRGSSWAQYLNLMDECWVANNQMVQACHNSFVNVPITVVPHSCDVSRYTQRYKPYPIPEIKERFTFYTIGELNRRKNLVALLKAFHTEFHPEEPVALIIKAHLPGGSPMECNNHLHVIINDVKRELKLYNNINSYHKEIIIMQDLTNEEVMRLHSTCDCFVMPSFGEAWNLPAFDAMAMGKTPICTDIGGMADYMRVGQKVAGWLVPGMPTPVFGMSNVLPTQLFIGDEEWIDINISGLRKAMREAFEDKETRMEKAELGINRAYDYSYEAIGQQMKTLLESK